jgi:hypothetical protein
VPFTFGNLPPLIANPRNHYINNSDLSIFQQLAMTEKLRMQFRAEAFNAFNRVRFSSPNTNVNGGATFGKPPPSRTIRGGFSSDSSCSGKQELPHARKGLLKCVFQSTRLRLINWWVIFFVSTSTIRYAFGS